MFSRAQYDAAHTSAIIVDGSLRGTIALAGADRAPFLHGLLTNDITRLTKGTGTYAAYLTPQGRMISDMHVLDVGDRLIMLVERDVAAPLSGRLDKMIFSEDVQVENLTDRVDVIGAYGPESDAIVQEVIGVDTALLTHEYDNVVHGDVIVLRDATAGMPGLNVLVPIGAAADVRAKLRAGGAVPADAETYETLRVEAGVPRFGADMTTETIPLEAGIENRAISFSKGCYVGQEVIIRVMHRGHGRVARRLVSLRLAGTAVPKAGDSILSGDRAIGEITSAVESPRAHAPLALGYVHRDFAAPDTALIVNGSEARVQQAVN